MSPGGPCLRLSALLCLSVPAASVAEACSIIAARQANPAEKRREARRLLNSATAVVDGEVVRPLRDGEPALVRAFRVLKGPRQEYFKVGERHSCDVALQRAGERLRMILVGGPDVYFLPADYSNARHEDRLLKSDRRKAWPYRQGRDSP